MFRHFARPEPAQWVKRFNWRGAAAVAAIAAVLPGAAHASMTLSLQLAPGAAGATATTAYISPAQVGADIPIYVYATVTGKNAVTPVPVGGTTASQPSNGAGDYDGIEFVYYNVNNTLAGSSNGGIDSATGHSPTLNTLGGTGFAATPAQPGLVQNIPNGIAVGSSNMADPSAGVPDARAASPIYDNYFTFSAANQTYTQYGNDSAGDIYLSNNNHSASFLLETLYFKPSFTAASFTASTTTSKVSTTYSISPVSFTDLEYQDANWFEDNPNSSSMPTTLQNGAYSVGASVSFVNTLEGDTNDDGKVDVTDLGTVALNYGQPGTKNFSQGDFNNDGKVDITDLGTIALNYGDSLTGASSSNLPSFASAWASAQASVPEPTSLSLLAAGALLLSRRRHFVIKFR